MMWNIFVMILWDKQQQCPDLRPVLFGMLSSSLISLYELAYPRDVKFFWCLMGGFPAEGWDFRTFAHRSRRRRKSLPEGSGQLPGWCTPGAIWKQHHSTWSQWEDWGSRWGTKTKQGLSQVAEYIHCLVSMKWRASFSVFWNFSVEVIFRNALVVCKGYLLICCVTR